MRWTHGWFRRSGKPARRAKTPHACRPRLLTLEDRTVPSTIVWNNDGGVPGRNDPDHFNAVFGANARSARAIVREAIKAWEELIVNFNYKNVGQLGYAPAVNTFFLSVSATSLRDNLRGYFDPFLSLVDRSLNDKVGLPEPGYGRLGKPFTAAIDVDDNGGGTGWYFDPTPRDHSEFTQVVTPFRARGNLGGRSDFYSTVLRLIGKAVGIAPEALQTEFGRTAQLRGMDPLEPNRVLYATSYYNRVSRNSPVTFLTQRAEQGIYEGPRPSNARVGDVVIANDLMTATPPVDTRDLISDVDIGLLWAGFTDDPFAHTPSYTLIFPTEIGRSFLVSPATGTVTVQGTSGNDTIEILSAPNGGLLVRMNGAQRVYSGLIRAVRVLAGAGNDTITVRTAFGNLYADAGPGDDTLNLESLPRGVAATMHGGPGRDVIRISPNLGDLTNIQGPVTIDGGVGFEDELILNDTRATSSNRDYILDAGRISLPGRVAIIDYYRMGSVSVFSASAPNATVRVRSTAQEAITIIDGAPVVNVGGPSLNLLIGGTFTDGIQGSLRIRNRFGRTALTIDDTGNNGTGRNLVLTANGLSGLTPFPILYGSAYLSSFTVNAGSAGNSFVVQDTGFPSSVRSIVLNTGLGNDTVRVERMNAPVTVNGQRGEDTVHVGVNGSVRGVTAPLTVTNGMAWSALTLDDSADPVGRGVVLASVGFYSEVSGLAPAAIRVRQRDLSAFTIAGGPGHNTFTVRNTPQSTFPGGAETSVRTGLGNDIVNVIGTSGPLAVDAQTGLNQIDVGMNPTGLSQLSGTVTVRGPGGLNFLTVNDSASTVGRAFVLDEGVVRRADKAAVVYRDLGANSSVAVRGGAGDDAFAVRSTAAGTPVSIDGGGGVNALDYSGVTGGAGGPVGPGVTGQVALYHADGSALDAAGGSHGVPVNGAAFAPGRFGQAFEFDGLDDAVRVANAPILEPTTVSVEAWVNASFPGYASYVVAKGASGNTAASYGLYAGGGGGLIFYVFDGATFVLSPNAGTGVWDRDWHHVVGTYDGASVRLYVDGVEVGNGTPTTIPIGYNLPSSNDLFIGSYNGGYNFAGRIDEVSIFNRALSAAEVQSRFTGGTGGPPDPGGPGVTVDLPQGRATGLSAVANVRDVTGSAGDDILVGGGGNVLVGGAGRDLLIAGASASRLFGGGGDDILIGGTVIDVSRANLEAIAAAWAAAGDGDDYSARAGRLRAGLLADGKVAGNGGGNTLTGGDGLDLFLGSLATDRQADEGDPAVLL